MRKVHFMIRKTRRNYWTACKMRRALSAPGSAAIVPLLVDCKRCINTSIFKEEQEDSVPDWLKYQLKMGYGGFTRRK